MKSPHHPGVAAQRLVLLHEADLSNICTKPVIAERFAKVPSCVFMQPRDNFQGAPEGSLSNFHVPLAHRLVDFPAASRIL